MNSKADFESFVAHKRAAAVHFDAAWDVDYRPVTRRRMLEAEEVLAEQVNFGEVDCQANPELATAAHILNVPSVAYYIPDELTSGRGILRRHRRCVNERSNHFEG